MCWYSKPTQLFVISSTVCILIYLCMDSRFNLIIEINFSMTQMYSYSLRSATIPVLLSKKHEFWISFEVSDMSNISTVTPYTIMITMIGHFQ